MNNKIQQIIDNYAHDYRNIKLDYNHLRAMLMEMLESILELQLIKPKTKKVKKYVYSREEIRELFGDLPFLTDQTKPYETYKASEVLEIADKLLATQPQPVKEESKGACVCGNSLIEVPKPNTNSKEIEVKNIPKNEKIVTMSIFMNYIYVGTEKHIYRSKDGEIWEKKL